MSDQLIRLAAAAAFVVLGSTAQAVTLDFENGTAGATTITGPYQEEGFTIAFVGGTSGSLYAAGYNYNVPESGSESLLIDGGGPAGFTIAATAGGAFDLLSLRVAEGRNTDSAFFPSFGATGISVSAQLLGGGTVSTSFAMDGVATDNPLTDFELATFSTLVGVTSVTFLATGGSSGYAFNVDDIVLSVAAVPLPAGALTLPFALAGFGALRRRRAARR